MTAIRAPRPGEGRPRAKVRNNGIIATAVPYEVENAVKCAAAERGMTISQFVRELLIRDLGITEAEAS